MEEGPGGVLGVCCCVAVEGVCSGSKVRTKKGMCTWKPSKKTMKVQIA